MIDPVAVLVDWLRTSSNPDVLAVRALTGDRVYGGRSWPSDYQPEDGPSVLLGVRPSPTPVQGPLLVTSVQYLCTGPSLREARELSLTLHEALDGGVGPRVKWGQTETLPQEVPPAEPGGWYTYLSGYKHWLDNS